MIKLPAYDARWSPFFAKPCDTCHKKTTIEKRIKQPSKCNRPSNLILYIYLQYFNYTAWCGLQGGNNSVHDNCTHVKIAEKEIWKSESCQQLHCSYTAVFIIKMKRSTFIDSEILYMKNLRRAIEIKS